MRLFIICLTILLSHCKKNDSAPGSSPAPSELRFSVAYRPPRAVGGEWTRVLKLHGAEGSVVVDKQLEGSPNWKEIGLTDETGSFYDNESTQRGRYRFGNLLVSPWLDSATDLIIDSATSTPASISGWRCIVREATTLYIGSGNLNLRCHEILILGNIQSFAKTPRPHDVANQRAPLINRRGRASGSVVLEAESIIVTGNISLVGEDGYSGACGMDTGIAGQPGPKGGAGGKLRFSQYKKLEILGTLNVSGGEGGPGGYHGNHTSEFGSNRVVVRRIYNGPLAASGARGENGNIFKE